MKISFDDELAVASILLADWAPALVEYLGRYFDVREDMLRLDYVHIPSERVSVAFDWLSDVLTVRQRFVYQLESVAKEGPIAMVLTLLGHESTEIRDSSSILDQDAYRSAVEDFRSNMLQGDLPALREIILADIAPRAIWMSWLLDADRDRFLDDREIMAALVASTSHSLKSSCFSVFGRLCQRRNRLRTSPASIMLQCWISRGKTVGLARLRTCSQAHRDAWTVGEIANSKKTRLGNLPEDMPRWVSR